MKFHEFMLNESFIKEKFSSLPSKWKDLYDSNKYKIHVIKSIKSVNDLDLLESYVKNKEDTLISLGLNSIMLLKDKYLYVRKEIPLSDYSALPQFRYAGDSYPISVTKILVDESDVVRIVSTIIEKFVADCFDFGQPLTLIQSIKLLGLTYKEILKEDAEKSRSSSNNSKTNNDKTKSSHSDPYIESYMNKKVLPKITEIKKSIPTIEKLENALLDIQDGKDNPIKIQNIINRINDLKKILEEFT